LKKFNAEYPEIHISVVNRTTQELIRLLKNGAVDLSFVNLPVEKDSVLDITPVMQFHDCFVTGVKYSYLADSMIRLRDLLKYPILMLEKSSNSRKQMDIFLRSYGLEIAPSIELDSFALLSEFAKIGLGIAATIKEDAQKMLDSNDLYELRFFETMPTRDLGMAQMRNLSLSFAAESFKKSILASTI
ncbi:MAG: LysR family transcriptional regulator substrate-binding protein, partial [Oscillospiraceae bacterium]|nr:LysR family transcriptional regulator substrate-binding protein [Oscillospiraceae bacterium]